MSDVRLRPVERLEVAVAAVALAVAVIGVTPLPLTTPLFVRTVVSAVGADTLTGLSVEATLDAAESVRRFVLDRGAPPLPSEIEGDPAFDSSAVAHLTDVRDVLIPTRQATLVLVCALAAWALIRRRSHRGAALIGRALTASALVLLAGAGLGIAVGLFDFDAFFAWFHSLFFAAGTWTFPESALLIRVFPLPFWTSAGAAWGVLVVVCAGLLLVLGSRLRFTRGGYGV